MAWLSKVVARESRNGDGGLFSRGLEMEIMFSAEEYPIDLRNAEPDLRLLEALSHAGATVTIALDGPTPEFQSADKLLNVPKDAPKPAPAAPLAPPETKGAPVPLAPLDAPAVCTICHTKCVTKVSKSTGKEYQYCPTCNANRKRNGRPFDDPVKGA